MFRRLALRRPRMPSLASRSREMGSMPFWLITTKPSPLSPHTCRAERMWVWHGSHMGACWHGQDGRGRWRSVNLALHARVTSSVPLTLVAIHSWI